MLGRLCLTWLIMSSVLYCKWGKRTVEKMHVEEMDSVASKKTHLGFGNFAPLKLLAAIKRNCVKSEYFSCSSAGSRYQVYICVFFSPLLSLLTYAQANSSLTCSLDV